MSRAAYRPEGGMLVLLGANKHKTASGSGGRSPGSPGSPGTVGGGTAAERAEAAGRMKAQVRMLVRVENDSIAPEHNSCPPLC